MLLDTNLLLRYIRKQENLPTNSYLSTITIGEIKSIAVRNNWGKQKLAALESIFDRFPILNVDYEMTDLYATIDAYSQGSLIEKPLLVGVSARNMGKNDLWIATIALFYDLELHTTDNDFSHLRDFGLKLMKY